MFRSLRPRLVLSYVLLTAIAVSLAGALTLTLVRRSLVAQETALLEANAEAISRQAASLLEARQPSFALNQLVATAAFLTETRVRILDVDRAVLADSGGPIAASRVGWLLGPEPSPNEINQPLPRLPGMWLPLPRLPGDESGPPASDVGPPGTQFIVLERSSGLWGPQLRFEPVLAENLQTTPEGHGGGTEIVAVPIRPGADALGYVELSSATSYAAAVLAAIRDALLFAGLGSAVVAGVVGLAISNSLTGPLRRLTTVARRMGSGELSARAEAEGRDEIGALGRQLNQMASDLEESFAGLEAERDALRRFIADASHELRTPLTALSNFNELLQGDAGDDPALRGEFLGAAQEQLERLIWLTTHLLDLSRLDAGLLTLERQPVAGAELVSATSRDFAPAAAERGVRLTLDLPPDPIHFPADPARLSIAYANLVENAIKFSPPDGVVTLGLHTAPTSSGEPDEITLWVADEGPGIDAAHLPHVFKRFYRAAPAAAGGTGLGLSIADSLARAHHGRVILRNRPEGGLWAGLTLPGDQTPA